METLFVMVSVLFLVVTVPGTLYLGLISIAGAFRPRPPTGMPMRGRIAVVVPAHDEVDNIARTVHSLQRAASLDRDAEIVVVADNCSDATARVARRLGVRVLERFDPDRRGKGYALDFAFGHLMEEDFFAFAVVDADTTVELDFFLQLRRHFGSGAAALQLRYTVLNSGDSPRTRLAEVALAAFNRLRPRGRQWLGISVGILGNGFALRREVLARIPYQADSVVEDLEYHLSLVRAGVRVQFVDQSVVRGEMPVDRRASASQRARWEGGRLRMVRNHACGLALRLLSGQWRQAEPLAELLVLPLAYHLMLISLSAGLALVAGAQTLLWGAIAISLCTLVLHVLLAMVVDGLPLSRLLALMHLPAYLVWKLRMIVPIFLAGRRNAAWIRTKRSSSVNGGIGNVP